MVEQLVEQAADDLAVLAVGRDENADILVREKRDRRLRAEHGAVMADDLRAAIIGQVPAQGVEVEVRLRRRANSAG